MKTATLMPADGLRATFMSYPDANLSSRRLTGTRSPKRQLPATVVEPSRDLPEEGSAPSQLAALFALKRAEKPPENFLQDFLSEFHRRNGISPAEGDFERKSA